MNVLEIYLRVILLYFIITSGSLFIAVKFNKKMGESIVINLLSTIIILYIFGLMNLLLVGTYIVVGLELLLGIITIIKVIKNKEKHILKEKIMSAGFFAFSVLFFWFMIVDVNKFLPNYDQYSYWSYAAKDMYMTNRFIIDPAINIQYPPAPTIIQYFFMKVIGQYIQGIELFSMQVLAFAMMLPWLDNMKRSKLKQFCIVGIMIFLPAIFSELYFYYSSIPEVVMGLLIGTSIYSFINEEESKFFYFKNMLILAVLTLIKPTGVFLAVITLIVEFIYEIIINKKINKQKIKDINNNKKIKFIFINLVIIIMVFTSWTIYKNINPPKDGRMTSANAKDNPMQIILRSMLNTTIGADYDTFFQDNSNELFMRAMSEKAAITTPVEISLISFVIIAIVGVVYYGTKKLKGKQRTKLFAILLATFIGFCLYCIILQMSYITMFNTKETITHAGIDRYLETYFVAVLYMIVYYAIQCLDKANSEKWKYLILLGIITIITPLEIVPTISYALGTENNKNMMNKYTIDNNGEIVEELLAKDNANADDAVYIINQDESHRLEYILRYTLYPRKTGIIDLTENMDKISMKLEEWVATLKEQYKYVFVVKTNEEFQTFAGTIFKNNQIEDKRLYKVKDLGDTIQLEPVK